jgi:hypothetical protein
MPICCIENVLVVFSCGIEGAVSKHACSVYCVSERNLLGMRNASWDVIGLRPRLLLRQYHSRSPQRGCLLEVYRVPGYTVLSAEASPIATVQCSKARPRFWSSATGTEVHYLWRRKGATASHTIQIHGRQAISPCRSWATVLDLQLSQSCRKTRIKSSSIAYFRLERADFC